MDENRETLVLPRPKVLRLYDRQFTLSQETLIVPAQSPECRREARFLSSLLAKGVGFKCRVTSSARSQRIQLRLVQRLQGIPEEGEGYRIRVEPNVVELTAATAKGLFYAGQTTLDLVQRSAGGWSLPCCEVHDWPDFRYRGFMADPARHFFSLERLKWDINNLARNKYNHFHLHFADAQSFTLPTRKYPNLNLPPRGPHNVYTSREISELCRYAGERKIEIIPEIDLPGHARYMLRQYPELKCRVAHGRASNWCICIGAESTYQFLDNLLGEIAPLFPGSLFHLGTDELEFRDRIEEVFTSWGDCSECRSRMRSEGLKNCRELFYYFVRRMRGILARHGKRMMMWNDNIDIAKPHTVPHDILLHFWRVASKGRGPHHGCSLSKFVKDGFDVVNSFYPETYLGYVKDACLVRWHPEKNPPIPRGHAGQIIGGECCAWSDGGMDPYVRTLPSSWAVFADRLWNRPPINDPHSFAAMLPKHIFGPQVPDEMRSYFHVLGAMVPEHEKPFTFEGSLLSPLPRKRRRELCEILLRRIMGERRKKRLMNEVVLKQYSDALNALRNAL